eukprot:COSAG03_NODE_33819_length_131_cov_22.156250_1_plen_26_part_01
MIVDWSFNWDGLGSGASNHSADAVGM